MRWALPAIGVLVLAGCAEARRPAVPEPPAALAAGQVVVPLPVILDLALRDHAQAGAGLRGRPLAAVLAAARLEWLAGETRDGRRLASLLPGQRMDLVRARGETRRALGMDLDATPEAAVEALMRLARALESGQEAGIEAALADPVFLAVNPPVRVRLSEPGPRPEAMLALTAAAEEFRRRGRLGMEPGVSADAQR